MPAINVHNAELYVEAMQSADWSLTDGQRRAREQKLKDEANERQRLQDQQQRSTALSSSSSSSSAQNPHMSSANRAQLDMLQGKRAVLEAEFRAKMDIAKRESDRRVHEKTMRQERQFEERYADFMAKNKEIVAASKMHEEVSALRERKRERLYQEWMQKVFIPTQGEINSKIEAANTEDIIAFRNQQYQRYLDECNRTAKHGGSIHRDIVVETQYNPFVVNAAATVKYKTVGLDEDPLKNRVTRESQLPGGSNAKKNGDSSPIGLSASISGGGISASLGSSSAKNNSGDNNNGATTKPTASLSARFGAKHDSYAQSHAHASKFQLLPSDALGTSSLSHHHHNNHTFSGAGFGGTAMASSSGYGQSITRPLLPAVGSVSLKVGTNASGFSASSSATTRENVNGYGDAPYKYSANTSLFNPTKEHIPLRNHLVDVKQWARMDATPHGRYSDDNRGPTGKPRVNPPGHKPDQNRSHVVFDHYSMPRGEEGVRQAKAEMVGIGKGKRCATFNKDEPHESPLC